jgi:hypothetical protein
MKEMLSCVNIRKWEDICFWCPTCGTILIAYNYGGDDEEEELNWYFPSKMQELEAELMVAEAGQVANATYAIDSENERDKLSDAINKTHEIIKKSDCESCKKAKEVLDKFVEPCIMCGLYSPCECDHECPDCNGTGYIDDPSLYENDEDAKCAGCKGSGQKNEIDKPEDA